MTRDEIIKMAEESGFVVDEKARQYQPNCIFHTHHMVDELLDRFAALVAAAEREACAMVAELVACEIDDTNGTATYIAAAIRSRGMK